MKRLPLFFILYSLFFVSVSAESVYRIDFSKAQAGWDCVQYTGKPWKFLENAFYDNGAYYSAVTMERNYSSTSTAKYMLTSGVKLTPGKYKVRTLALKEGGSPSVTLSYFPLSAKDESEVIRIARLNLGTHYTEDAVETHTIEVTTEEKYYFTFDGETAAGDYHTPYLFRFEIVTFDDEGGGESGGGESGGGESGGGESGGDEPTPSDLLSSSLIGQWTAIDANGDGKTWAMGTTAWTYNGLTASKGADDYLVSPALSVKANTDYELALTFEQAAAFDPDNVVIVCGDQPTATALTTQIGTMSIYGKNGAGTVDGRFRLSAPADGNIHVAVYLKGGEPNGTLALTAATLTEVEKATPNPVTGFTAYWDTNDHTVTLRWTNPSTDTKDMPIAQPLTINIYENGKLMATKDDRVAGTEETFVFAPTAAGDVTYAVAAVLAGVESAKEEQTINLDDNSGTWTLVASLADVTRDTFGDWRTEDKSGAGSWAFGWGNAMAFTNKSNIYEDDWLISPGVTLDTDKRYLAVYEIQTQEAFSANIAVTIGDAQTSEAQTRTIKTHARLYQNGFGKFTSSQFTVTEGGTCYFGFHLTAAECMVYVRNLEIYEVAPIGTGVLAPTQKTAISSQYDLSGRQTKAARGLIIRDGKKLLPSSL